MSASLKRFLRSFWLLGVLALGGKLQAQVQTYRHFGERDGLPQSQVFKLLEDREGFLWVGTGEGVARLGASGFQAFGAAKGVRTMAVADLLQDRAGALWVAAQEGGVDRILGGRATSFGAAEGLAAAGVFCLAEDAAGRILAGTRRGLFATSGERFERVDLPDGWNELPIFALAQDSLGRLWLASTRDHLASWDGHSLARAVLPERLESRFRGLQVDAAGQVWALTSEALYCLGRDQVWRRDPLPGLEGRPLLQSFQVTPQGELLLALAADGAYLRSPGGAFRKLDALDGLPRERISAVFRDSRGFLWLGTDGDGLHAEAVPGLLALDADPRTGEGLGLGSVLAFQEDGPDRMLMGSTTGLRLWIRGRGLAGRWDTGRGLPSPEVWSLQPRAAGGAWVATRKGLVAWDGRRILPGPPELARTFVPSLLVHAGRLWACTYEQGLVELDLQGRFVAAHPAPAEVGEPSVLAAVPDGDGLMVATANGAYRFRDGTFRPAFRNTLVGTRSLTCLYRGPGGELWVGTASGGVFGFPSGEEGPCEAYGEAQAGIHGRVTWIGRLGSGDLAVGHGRGVTILRPTDGGKRVLRLTRNLGLLSDETFDSAVLRDHLGRLWIGMIGGACVLDPAAEVPPARIPRPMVLDASTATRAFHLPRLLSLPPRAGTLTLHFDAPDPLLPARLRYQVWLDGAWRDVEDANNRFQIGHLGPGGYRVRIRAGDGVDWVESEPVGIKVREAWYQTLWARLLLVLVGAWAAVLLFNWRMRRIRARATRLEAKVQERTEELTQRNHSLERLHRQLKRSLEGRVQLMNTVTHDLRSPLTSILISVERLEGRVDEKGHQVLRILSKEAQRVERLLRQLLDRSRAESLTEHLRFRACRPGEILEGMSATLHMKAEARGLQARLEVDPELESAWVLADVEAIQQVLFNLIENALKFTDPPGEVGIRSRSGPGSWVLEVWDTGRGIAPDHAASLFRPFNQAREDDAERGWGLGLSICWTLLEAHQGAIEVESTPGRGSLFRVALPLVAEELVAEHSLVG